MARRINYNKKWKEMHDEIDYLDGRVSSSDSYVSKAEKDKAREKRDWLMKQYEEHENRKRGPYTRRKTTPNRDYKAERERFKNLWEKAMKESTGGMVKVEIKDPYTGKNEFILGDNFNRFSAYEMSINSEGSSSIINLKNLVNIKGVSAASVRRIKSVKKYRYNVYLTESGKNHTDISIGEISALNPEEAKREVIKDMEKFGYYHYPGGLENLKSHLEVNKIGSAPYYAIPSFYRKDLTRE